MSTAVLLATRRHSWIASPMGIVRAYPIGALGAVLTSAVVIAVLIGPIVWRQPSDAQNLANAFLSPSATHPLGTDQYGRDLLSRTLTAGRLSLVIGLGSVILALVVGVLLGVIAAMRARVTGAIVMRLTDALLALPGIVQALVLVAVLGRGPIPLVIALSISTVPIFTRMANGSTAQVLQQDYMAATKCIGIPPWRAALVHVLPNIMSPILAVATLRTGANLLIAAALNYFGLGVQPPTAEWGLMIAEGQTYSSDHPALIIIPGVCIFVVSLGFNLLGDGIRDRLDPRLRGR